MTKYQKLYYQKVRIPLHLPPTQPRFSHLYSCLISFNCPRTKDPKDPNPPSLYQALERSNYLFCLMEDPCVYLRYFQRQQMSETRFKEIRMARRRVGFY
ncbi:hypothetical protein CDAR_532401 [Caerostris darwini]|uniref:Uncharacterized protein n=1 Tax=Caerostris darwini TaxID=1538125 RepID=A0AAV4QA81_9ARAC|nr:hypothetical protein CDAR_532401 [Caerostris darwini]